MSEAISVSGLTKSYGGRTVLDHLNLSVKAGTVFGLLGANGAGKSTTIECMLGTKRADGGTVSLLGQDPVRDRRALFERIGVQFQEGTISRRSGSSSCARRRPACTGILRTTGRSVRASASGTSCKTRSGASPAASASGCSSCWRCCPTRSWSFWTS